MTFIQRYSSLVKISHTIFAMPFALVGYFLAVHQTAYSFSWTTLLCVVLCMFFARNAAMSFNRYADKKWDALNARTAQREIPRGSIAPKNALLFCIVNALLFVLTTLLVNRICFLLSPVALAIVLGYSYTKRFTSLCHFILGLGLSVAPMGAYLAVTAQWDAAPLLVSLLVLLWTAGFDIIYALPDQAFDKSQQLRSIPAAIGIGRALVLSAWVHLLCVALVGFIGIYLHLGALYYIGGALFAACLVYEHCIVNARNLSRVNMAFATLNGIAGVVFCLFFVLEMYL
ncbi:4-hydroxybenzoate octaprenyltransferase [Bacteroidia bacterium]|nr:4-hydroxybenzoate octaprenyltransferase [Bacteroidia bacterium]